METKAKKSKISVLCIASLVNCFVFFYNYKGEKLYAKNDC